MQNQNRRVECDVCNKPMRSDNLKRHKQTHKYLLKKELKTHQEIKNNQEGKLQKN